VRIEFPLLIFVSSIENFEFYPHSTPPFVRNVSYSFDPCSLILDSHDEWVVHGSGGNLSKGTRRTYVIAFRTEDTVKRERAAGFTHSHLDQVNWDSFNPGKVG